MKYSCRNQSLDIKNKNKNKKNTKNCRAFLQDSLILWNIVEVEHKDNAHPERITASLGGSDSKVSVCL